MPKKPSKPHDEFFKASFGRKEVALEYLQSMLPADVLATIDLEKLERINGSFVSPALQPSFSDVVYLSPLRDDKHSIYLSFIFEHKSKPESRPHLQLLRYMLDAWNEQLNHGQKFITPIVPILIYHGKQGWKKRKMTDYFGKKLPESLLRYTPSFDYIFTHVRNLSDEQILELSKGLLINTLLMMKHIWEPEYILQNPQLIFINLDEPNQHQDFIVFMLAYFLKNTEIGKDKVQDFIQSLPKVLNQTAMSTYDMIVKDAESKFEELLVIERQRTEEERHRAEEERQRLNNTILNLHQIAKMPISEIALMTGAEIEYVEALIAKANTDKAN
jgi:predicted transposase/invertase (TIGR01784 family)